MSFTIHFPWLKSRAIFKTRRIKLNKLYILKNLARFALKNLTLKHKKSLSFPRGFSVGLLGLEPRKTAPKTVVLPLHHRPAVRLSGCKIKTLFNLCKF